MQGETGRRATRRGTAQAYARGGGDLRARRARNRLDLRLPPRGRSCCYIYIAARPFGERRWHGGKGRVAAGHEGRDAVCCERGEPVTGGNDEMK